MKSANDDARASWRQGFEAGQEALRKSMAGRY